MGPKKTTKETPKYQTGWRRILFYIGIVGVLNILWWITAVMEWFLVDRKKNQSFLGKYSASRKVIYWWGWVYVVMAALILLFVVLSMFKLI